MDCSPPGFSVHGIYRQEYWSGLPFPPPEYAIGDAKELEMSGSRSGTQKPTLTEDVR